MEYYILCRRSYLRKIMQYVVYTALTRYQKCFTRKIVPSKTNIRIMKSNKIAIERRDRHVDKKITHFVVSSRWYYHDYSLTFFVK